MKMRISPGFASPKGSLETMVEARGEAKRARNEGGICRTSIDAERPTRADVVTAAGDLQPRALHQAFVFRRRDGRDIGEFRFVDADVGPRQRRRVKEERRGNRDRLGRPGIVDLRQGMDP